jgi:DNA repair protein RecO (recombination protein O)
MLEKTKGIVLNRIKYSDSGIIVRLYTRKFGRQSFLIRGMRNTKAGRHNILFQPLFILDLEMNYKHSREMQVLKEFSVSFAPYEIHSDIRKSCVALFLGEVLTSVLKEESPHEEMFDFIEESIIYFDSCKEGFANFHIAFLAGLSSFLGFQAGPRTDNNDTFFDLKNGSFVEMPPVHGNYANETVSNILADFYVASYDTAGKIPLTGTMRNEVLETLVKYYSLHLPALRKLKSLEVLKEVFG